MTSSSTKLQESGESFEEWVRHILASALPTSRNQEDLYVALPGLFPGTLADLLSVSELEIRDVAFARLREMREGDPKRRALVDTGLTLPHPLDYEWLFTRACVNSLAKEILDLGVSSVACVGTPSLYRELTAVAPNMQKTLVDRVAVIDQHASGAPTGDSHFVLPNISDVAELPDHELGVVDAPWYPEHTVHFAGAAASLVKPGGAIWVVVPPACTRPGVVREVESIISRLSELGLSQVEKVEGKVRYQSPPFEVSTLRSMGLYGVPHNWRVGDLLKLRVTRPVGIQEIPPLDQEAGWSELRHRSSRIKFRSHVDAPLDTVLSPVIEGGVLLSVSRRDTIRGRVAVWTSGNRGFLCGDPTVLKVGYEAFVLGLSPEDAYERATGTKLPTHAVAELAESIRRLAEVVELEEDEIEWL